MSYTFKTQLINRKNYGVIRNLSSIKYIVIHYTANDGDTDENNATYFTNNVVKVSAHYFVDDDSVTQCVPDNYVAYHCGTKGTYKHSKCRNENSLAIEICDDVKNGVIYPSAKTIANAIEHTKKLMKQYNIPQENVIRHFDVTGKICPAYWCGTTEKNNKWKTEFWNKLVEAPSKPTTQTTQKTYKFKIGDKVVINGNLYKNANAKTPVSTVKNKTTVITRRAENTLHPYNTTGDLGWMNESDIKLATTTKPTTSKPATPKTYKKGDIVKLSNTSLYKNATTAKASSKKTGTYYIYDGVKTNGRYRITNKANRCGKKPIWMYVTGWIKL